MFSYLKNLCILSILINLYGNNLFKKLLILFKQIILSICLFIASLELVMLEYVSAQTVANYQFYFYIIYSETKFLNTIIVLNPDSFANKRQNYFVNMCLVLSSLKLKQLALFL